MIKEWYKDWFSSDYYLEVYKHRNFEDTENLVELILSNTDIKPDAKILDAACGAGRYSIKFAERGFDVTGFDLSKSMLEIAENEASIRNLKIDFQHYDLRHFKSEKKFNLVLSLFTSFGYFESDDENFLFPQNAYNYLKEKGYYILDYLNKGYLETNLVENSEKFVEDNKITETRFIKNNRIQKKIIISNGEENKEYLESVKLYSYEEIVKNFENIGFNVKKVFGNYLGENYNKQTSERCIIIFQK
ncbi:MAG: class I SAM-dependent methyltransferase [Ignavibacteriae bacterium]|nr:class I SAM-dependent methyltransferase [Ignavibacteriota bacterium]MCB9206719.1 class I SAM-dependent methyltransferase [Ignavibacteriales bacterium]MCB9210566.1 class I SAM-dependent methyltransferase [Ignavibacteriales bacterium]MCB9219941.1 class I SAM-dependent methyltransferase [Ignavibacteriales bacterium]